MNANPKFLAAQAHVDAAAVQPFPGSRKVHVGPLRVPILPNMQESYPVRVGLFSPETKTQPAVLGATQRIAGTLTVRKTPQGGQQVSFQAEK